MLDTLKYIFSDFWIFFGMLVFMLVIFNGITEIINAFKKQSIKSKELNKEKGK